MALSHKVSRLWGGGGREREKLKPMHIETKRQYRKRYNFKLSCICFPYCLDMYSTI